MVALIHNILPPYRVPLFNALAEARGGEFVVVLARETHRFRRAWRVPWEDVKFQVCLLRTLTVRLGDRSVDISVGVGAALNKANPDAVIVAGWDLPACWLALAWARRHGVPVYAWVESGLTSGSLRGPISTTIRRIFLGQCKGAVVPGDAAASFVSHLAPSLRLVRAPNSVGMPVNRSIRAPKPPWSAIFVGELSERKGFDVVLDAVPDLLSDFSQLTVAGVGPMATRIEAMAARDPRIRYLGFVEGEPLASALSAASVVLIPSRKDPWPLVAVEALTMGRPVVVGPGVGSAPDLAKLAGAAVTRMPVADAASLVVAARDARTRVVPMLAREPFQPDAVAAQFLSVVDHATRDASSGVVGKRPSNRESLK